MLLAVTISVLASVLITLVKGKKKERQLFTDDILAHLYYRRCCLIDHYSRVIGLLPIKKNVIVGRKGASTTVDAYSVFSSLFARPQWARMSSRDTKLHH